ncbi:MAG TPA: GNAT family N-acetyltransferase [Solirubrobacteraceae bacterium]|jgi:GNAT superfamily N-acetyltransferase|nr:GNAT family N-acetyltransferase [Solirubrobacteraceae bacterium]
MTASPYESQVVDEERLSDADRRRAGALLAGEWGEQWRRDAHAGPYPPEFRILARGDHDELAGHVAAFAIPTEPAVRLYGIGDLVVAPAHRRRGVAHRLCSAVVGEAWRRGAQLILVDTLAAESIFLGLGFTPAPPFRYFYVRDRACHRHRHWLAAGRLPHDRLELLEHGDF